jgi:hypothetical protein
MAKKSRTVETNQTRYWFTKLDLVIEVFDIKRFKCLDFTLGLTTRGLSDSSLNNS